MSKNALLASKMALSKLSFENQLFDSSHFLITKMLPSSSLYVGLVKFFITTVFCSSYSALTMALWMKFVGSHCEERGIWLGSYYKCQDVLNS
jgi:hypothetical protein